MLRFFSRRTRTIKVPVENGSVAIQKVEVKQRSKPVFRFLIRLAVAYCVVRTIWWLRSDEFKISVEDLKKTREPVKGQNGIKQTGTRPTSLRDGGALKPNSLVQKNGNQNSIMHLTMPIWFRERKREFFKSSDLEWQAVQDLLNDQKRSLDLKRQVVKTIALGLTQSPVHVRQLQFVQFNQTVGHSIEIIAPLWAPLSYEVPCVFIGRDWTLEFGWRALSRAASAKTERIFHPLVFSQAFIAGVAAFSTATFHLTKAKILDQYYGSEPLQIKLSMVQQGTRKNAISVAIQQPMSRHQIIVSQLPVNRLSEEQAKLPLPSIRETTNTDSTFKKHSEDTLGATTYQHAIGYASSVFQLTFMDKQVAAIQDSTQGVCHFRGNIDFIGARGTYRVEVVAIYAPSANAFIGGPRLLDHYIIPDMTNPQSKRQTAPVSAGAKPQQSHSTDKMSPMGQSRPPTEQPSPSKDAGK